MTANATPNRPLNEKLHSVTQRIKQRSQASRKAYLDVINQAKKPGTYRQGLGCANAAHAYAAMPAADKIMLTQERQPNLGIITAYNDMLSAHQPYEHYPQRIRQLARQLQATAQVAGGVPAMCDGVTQGEAGMELSLFSRDVIALAAAVGLSHQVFDAALMLGVCDKIVPGLFIGALQFGHLPVVFLPAGPMTTGLSNDAKSSVRQKYAQGLASRAELLAAEQAAYHGAGTCTFYGTANSNQMLMEIMGLHLPGSSFVNPGTELRDHLTDESVRCALRLCQQPQAGMGHLVSVNTIVNGMVGLLATGGSTNHTIHLVAMAKAAGWLIDWDDFSELSECVPLLARVYPNGEADVNHFHAAGGMGFLIGQLLKAGLLHDDVQTICGAGLSRYQFEPWLNQGQLDWRPSPAESADDRVLRPVERPFSKDGGLKRLQGNLGRCIIKVSAVKPEHQQITAPAVVVNDQKQLIEMYNQRLLEKDFVAVVRYQGPRANGMPELHKLTPVLGVLQDRGFKVALLTDGRMSGASGKVPAAIHLTPEAAQQGPIAKIRNGDLITVDCLNNLLQIHVDQAQWNLRTPEPVNLQPNQRGSGRDLFQLMRQHADLAENGASALLSLFQPAL